MLLKHLYFRARRIALKMKRLFRRENYGRKDSAIRTLVAETLVLAKTHGYVEKIESELEKELLRESRAPPKKTIARWRQKSEKIFFSKHMLIAVVIFCILDCALVLGELILDLHKVKDTLEKIDQSSTNFVTKLKQMYPKDFVGLEINMDLVYEKILQGTLVFNGSASIMGGASSNYSNSSVQNTSLYATDSPLDVNGTISVIYNETNTLDAIAHAFHLASISILALLVVETILKSLSSGTSFLKRKLEVFDAIIVIISFVVDLILVNGLPRYKIQDFVFILAFLLPWRVIRVVNSLVVSVKDHEHFRLKLLYSRKKKIQNSLRETEAKLQVYKHQCNSLKKLCLAEGIDELKILDSMKTDELFTVKTKGKSKIKIDDDFVLLVNGHGKGNRKTSFLNVDGQSTPRRASLVQIENVRRSPSPRIKKKHPHSFVQNGDLKWQKAEEISRNSNNLHPEIIIERSEMNGCSPSVSTNQNDSVNTMHESNNQTDFKQHVACDSNTLAVKSDDAMDNSGLQLEPLPPTNDSAPLSKTLHSSASCSDVLNDKSESLYSSPEGRRLSATDPSISGDNKEDDRTPNGVLSGAIVLQDSTVDSESKVISIENQIPLIQSSDNPVLGGETAKASDMVINDRSESIRL